MQASAVAKLGVKVEQVVHGWFQLPGDCKAKPEEYLPFPDFDPEAEKREARGPSRGTELVLRELISKYRIPMHVFVALMKPGES